MRSPSGPKRLAQTKNRCGLCARGGRGADHKGPFKPAQEFLKFSPKKNKRSLKSFKHRSDMMRSEF